MIVLAQLCLLPFDNQDANELATLNNWANFL